MQMNQARYDKYWENRKLFKNYLNRLCFVKQSSNTRLSANQKYIFPSVLDLFGKSVKENFITILTFCENKVPQVVV